MDVLDRANLCGAFKKIYFFLSRKKKCVFFKHVTLVLRTRQTDPIVCASLLKHAREFFLTSEIFFWLGRRWKNSLFSMVNPPRIQAFLILRSNPPRIQSFLKTLPFKIKPTQNSVILKNLFFIFAIKPTQNSVIFEKMLTFLKNLPSFHDQTHPESWGF